MSLFSIFIKDPALPVEKNAMQGIQTLPIKQK